MDMVKVCDICGDVGYSEVVAICSLCKSAREHIYCMRVYYDDVPDSWVCDSCGARPSRDREGIALPILVDECHQTALITQAEPNFILQSHQASTQSKGNEDGFVYSTTPNNKASAKKRVRGAARGVSFNRNIATMRQNKITWNPTQGKPVGKVRSLLNREIGILVRKLIPLQYEKKKCIPDEFYDIITKELLKQFDVDISQPYIERHINHEIGTRFKDYRSTLYKHYEKYSSPLEARQNPHKYTTHDDWNMLCNRWECSSWKETSAKNKANRSKIQFNHRAGSKSFQSHQEHKEKENGTYVSPIEVFYHTHYSASNGWIDKAAKEAHEKLLILRETEKDSSIPKSDEEIMVMVLGKRPSYTKRLGYISKSTKKKEASFYSQEYVESLETRLKKMEELLERQRLESEQRSSEGNGED